MTAQIANSIRIEGSPYLLLADAMGGFFERHGRPRFCARGTANWKGYTTDWLVVGDRLFLSNLDGTICLREPEEGADPTSACAIAHFSDCYTKSVSLTDFIEAGPEGVFADWVSEDLRIASGDALRYIHAGWATRYQHEECLRVRKGIVISRFDLKLEVEPEAHELSSSVWSRFRSALQAGW